MTKSIPLFAAALLAATVPGVASAEVAVDFAFKKSELNTAESRESLLARIQKVSRQSCKSSSRILPKSAIKRCAADLSDQFVRAIDDPQLTLLAETGSAEPFRTAAR